MLLIDCLTENIYKIGLRVSILAQQGPYQRVRGPPGSKNGNSDIPSLHPKFVALESVLARYLEKSMLIYLYRRLKLIQIAFSM